MLLGQDQISKFKTFSLDDGLNTKTVYNFAQDRMGFIWLATGNGLYRSDGYVFKKIESPIDNYKNRIGSICEIVHYDNASNRLYILSYSDIQFLDLKNYTFHRISAKEAKNIVNEKYAFFLITKSKLWYGGRGFLYEIEENKTAINLIPLMKDLPADARHNFIDIIDYNKEEVIINCTNYILFVNKKTYRVTNTIKAKNGQHFMRTTYDKDQSYLWIAAYQSLVGYNLLTKKSEVYQFPFLDNKNNKFNRLITASTYINDSELLLTNNVIFNTKTRNHFIVKEMIGNHAQTLKNEFSHFKDRDGNIWRGSIHQGCDVLLANKKHTSIYGPLINEKGINIEPYTSFLSADNEKIYVAGSGVSGYCLIDIKNKKFQHIHNPYNDTGYFVVNDVLEYDGYIYTCDNKNIYKSQEGKFKKILHNQSFSSESFSGIEQLALWKHELIAISATSLNIIDLKNNEQHSWTLADIDKEITSTTNPYFIPHFEGKNGMFYYSSNVGLYHQKNRRSKPEKIKLLYNNEVLQHSIISLAEDAQGKIWLGTLDYGVWIYDPKSNKVHPLKESNSIYSFSGINKLTIFQESAYIGTQSAILVYDTATEKFQRAMNNENGFYIDDSGYEIKNQNDHLITINVYPYVVTYKKDTIHKKKNQITFTSLKISNKEMIEKPTTDLPVLKLKHPDHSFSLAFTDLNFFKNQFQNIKYRLVGLDTSWQISNDNKIEYYRLPNGEYNLELAYIDQSIDNRILCTLPIYIMPPFYKTWWFISIILLSTAGLFYLRYRQKINMHRHEFNLRSDYEKQLASLEMKALRAQMNPHFIFNSINSIQKFIFEKDDYDASQYLTKFSKLIRMILDQSNQDYATISSEIEMLRLYLDMESLRFDHSFDYQFHIDENLSMDVKLPSMVIQPHIENAIWHGLQHKDEHGILDIFFNSKNEFLEIIIDDNGIGREKAKEFKSKTILKAKSYGSKISEDRVRIFNGLDGDQPTIQYIDKKDATGLSIGTTVIINISLTGNMNYN